MRAARIQTPATGAGGESRRGRDHFIYARRGEEGGILTSNPNYASLRIFFKMGFEDVDWVKDLGPSAYPPSSESKGHHTLREGRGVGGPIEEDPEEGDRRAPQEAQCVGERGGSGPRPPGGGTLRGKWGPGEVEGKPSG